MWRPAYRNKLPFWITRAHWVGEVFHYSFPVNYSGIPWGWIHLSLSTDQLSKDVRAIISGCSSSHWQYDLGPGGSVLLQKLSLPIQHLNQVTQEVARETPALRPGSCQGTNWESGRFFATAPGLQRTQMELS
jgi:hypothetical protein